MSYTGGYETRYDTLTQGQLNALFSSAQWAGLSFAERLDACQEVANRYAAEHDVEPCLITHHPMEGSAYGEQFGSTIRLNTYLVWTASSAPISPMKTETAWRAASTPWRPVGIR